LSERTTEITDLLASYDLTERPAMAQDVLKSREEIVDILRRNGIDPSERVEENNMMVDILKQLDVCLDDRQAAGQVLCVVMVLHTMMSGGSMRGYESLVHRLRQWNQIPLSVRLTGDDSGWCIVEAANTVVLAHLRSRIKESPYLSISIDDSDDSGKLEQCAIVIYLLFNGRRQAHLVKFHALPGADTCADDLSREVLHVLCTDPPAEPLRGEGTILEA
jgi:hypothetical protein